MFYEGESVKPTEIFTLRLQICADLAQDLISATDDSGMIMELFVIRSELNDQAIAFRRN